MRSTQSTPSLPLSLVYSYAREDETYCEQLAQRLSMLEHDGVISQWRDRSLTAGAAWEDEISKRFQEAQVIVLICSDDFLASDFIREHELPWSLARAKRGESLVIPVMVRPVSLLDRHPISKLQALPSNQTPVSQWPDRDSAWADVTSHILRSIQSWSRAAPKRKGPMAYAAAALLFVAGALLAAFTYPSPATYSPTPAWVSGELIPAANELVRTTSDLSVAAGNYLNIQPESQDVFDAQLRDVNKAVAEYEKRLAPIRRDRDGTRARLQELRESDPELAEALTGLLEFVLSEFHEVELPQSKQTYNVQFGRLVTFFSAFESDVVGRLQRVQSDLDHVEKIMLERVQTPRCGSEH